MDTLTGIKVFRQIVESGSFVAAANRLELQTLHKSESHEVPSADTEMVYWRERAHQLRCCGLSAAAE